MRFLLVKPSSLGDVACAMPVVTLLKQHFPNAKVDWLVNAEYAGLVKAAGADRVFKIDRQSWKNWKTWPKAFKSYFEVCIRLPFQNYDYTIDLQGLLRSAFFTFLSLPKRAIGFADGRELSPLFYGTKVKVQRAITHAAICNLEVLKQLGIEPPLKWPVFAPAKTGDVLERFGLEEKKYFLAVPKTRWQSKDWLPDCIFQTALSLYEKKGWRCVLIGGASDAAICAEIAKNASDKFVNAAGKTTWEELLILASRAALAITPDTGPMHVLAAAGTPIVAVMGPTGQPILGVTDHMVYLTEF